MHAIVGWSSLFVAVIVLLALPPTGIAVTTDAARKLTSSAVQNDQASDELLIVDAPAASDANDTSVSHPALTSAPTSPQFQPANDPLPPAFWPGLLMLGLVAAMLGLWRVRRRTA
jgi:hypothetical protein